MTNRKSIAFFARGLILGIGFLYAMTGFAVTGWTTDPANCDTSYLTIDCPEGQTICAYQSNQLKCAVPATVTAALPSSAGTADNKLASGTGGYQVNCTKDASICTPYAGLWECKASTTCAAKNLKTNCAGSAHTATCGTCLTNYLDCDGVGTGVDANGCEIQVGGACTLGSVAGVYAATCEGSSPPTCITPTVAFQTGTLAEQSSSDPLLWGKQYGSGDLLNLSKNGGNSVVIKNDGKVGIGTTSPSSPLVVNAGANDKGFLLENSGGTDLAWLHQQSTDAATFRMYDGGVLNTLISSNVNANSYFNSGGNVGIGTTSPSAKLEVAGDIKVGATEKIYFNTEHTGIRSDVVNELKVRGYGGVIIETLNTGTALGGDIILNPVSGGNVGIGTTSPEFDLHIASGATARPVLFLENTVSGTADPRVLFGDSVEDYSYSVGLDDTSNKFAISYGSTYNNAQAGTNDRLVITEAGNVGIGTTGPGAKLEIENDQPVGLYIDSSYGSDHWLLKLDSIAANPSGFWEASDNINFLLRNSSGDVGVYLKSSGDSYFNGGNVGIGTDSPNYKLDVGDFSNGNEVIRLAVPGSSDASIRFMEGSDVNGMSLFFDGGDNNLYIKRHSNSEAGTPVMTFQRDSGNVGIGTTSPGAKLEVFNSGAVNSKLTASGGGAATFIIDGNGDSALSFHRALGGERYKIYRPSGTSDLRFNNATTDIMSLTSTGNVGIGTDSPNYKLHVNGAMMVTDNLYISTDGSTTSAPRTIGMSDF